MGLGDITRKEFGEEPKKGLKVLWQKYNRILGESRRYKSEFVKNYIKRKIIKDKQKKKIDATKANYLMNHLDKETISPYLEDFVIQAFLINAIGLGGYSMCRIFGPDYKFVENSLLNEAITYFISGAIAGPILRTSWTFVRIGYESVIKFKKEKKLTLDSINKSYKERKIALKYGLLPYIGVLAYPKQMIYSERLADKNFGEYLDNNVNELINKIPGIKKLKKVYYAVHSNCKNFVNSVKK